MGTLQDTLIVHLGVAMLLALWRPILHQLLGVHLGPVHLRTAKSPTGTLDADGPLYDFKPWAGIRNTTKKDTSVTFWAERNFFLSYI